MRVAIYCRVSSEQQKDDQTINAQKYSLPQYAISRGWEIVKSYEDNGISGTTFNRPSFQDLIRDMVNKTFDILLVVRHDRITRSESAEERGLIIDLLKKYDIKLASPTEGFLDLSTFGGEIIATIQFLFAAEENKKRKELFKSGRQRKCRENKHGQGRTPFGFRFAREATDKKGNKTHIDKYFVDEDEKNIYLSMISLLLTNGFSLGKIAKELNIRGYRSRLGKEWSATTVGKILKNKTYFNLKIPWGNVSYSTVNGKRVTHKLTIDEKKTIGTDKPIDLSKHDIEPFIDEFTYLRIIKKIQNNITISRNIKSDDKFLMRGLLYCSHCGGKLATHQNKFYVCLNKIMSESHYINGKKKCKKAPFINREFIDKLFWNEFLLTVGYPDVILGTIDNYEKRNQRILILTNDEKRIKSEVKKNEKSIERIANLFIDGKFSKDMLYKRKDQCEADINKLHAELIKIHQEIEALQNYKINLKRMKDKLDKLSRREFMNQKINDMCEFKNKLHLLPFHLKQDLMKDVYSPGINSYERILLGVTHENGENSLRRLRNKNTYVYLDNYYFNFNIDSILNILKRLDDFKYLNQEVSYR